MKEKMLKEKGGAKVYIIVIVVLLALCIGLGVFAVMNMNKDKKDDEKTSKKNETNTSKTVKDDKKDNKNEADDEDDSLVKYTGTVDMTKVMGTDDLKDTVWTLSVEGNDDTISKLVIRAELEKYLKEQFDILGDSSDYTYEEFIEAVQDNLDDQMSAIGTEFATELGVSSSLVKSKVNWVEDETLEIEVDLSKVKKSEYDVDDDESLIEYVVEAFKDEGVKMKKSK